MADDIDFETLAGPSGTSGAAEYDLAEDPSAAGLLAELDRKSAARKLALPTNDLEVKRRLRSHGEPITLFGEKREDRRERLRVVIIRQRQAQGMDINMEEDESSDEEEEEEQEKEEEFYTEGDDALEAARRWITAYSLPRAKRRILKQRQEAQTPLGRILDVRKSVFAELKTYTSLGSQFADERPICSVRFSPNSQYLCTGSWSGTVKVWDVPGCTMLDELKGHNGERIGGVAWHPQATLSQSPEAVNVASSGADFNIQLWNLAGLESKGEDKKPSKPLSTLSGHSHRVVKVAFHPSGRYLSSASYDGTWRLWDVETSKELLLQEGHSKEVYSVAFQPTDGSLMASGGLDAIGRVWDLRSGRSVMVLDGHIRDILSIDWSEATGYQLATGSNDDTIKIWDMRMLKCLYTIPGHKSSVSDVKFFKAEPGMLDFPKTIPDKKVQAEQPKPNGSALVNGDANGEVKKEEEDVEDVKPDVSNAMEVDAPSAPAGWGARAAANNGSTAVPLSGMYLASAGYDGYVKIWSADDWQLVKSLNSEAGGRVMSVDLAQNGKFLATGEWSRTFKLFSAADIQL
ncbi:WD40 repeat-like protein [Cystobasidium minutum MCA 4210]|uniref:WD40 repeat-like protein n=1 Tax=Cystobasidium minutum MCA 4210 TaxID=1397322 RepID=UPI0034CDF899|eukprot:jgi/Rhomi1/193353/gm1.1567_g